MEIFKLIDFYLPTFPSNNQSKTPDFPPNFLLITRQKIFNEIFFQIHNSLIFIVIYIYWIHKILDIIWGLLDKYLKSIHKISPSSKIFEFFLTTPVITSFTLEMKFLTAIFLFLIRGWKGFFKVTHGLLINYWFNSITHRNFLVEFSVFWIPTKGGFLRCFNWIRWRVLRLENEWHMLG